MRKSILSPDVDHAITSSDQWLDLEELASVEVSSENPLYPFEDALYGAERDGWKAAAPGTSVDSIDIRQAAINSSNTIGVS
jgi:hypothetical protein